MFQNQFLGAAQQSIEIFCLFTIWMSKDPKKQRNTSLCFYSPFSDTSNFQQKKILNLPKYIERPLCNLKPSGSISRKTIIRTTSFRSRKNGSFIEQKIENGSPFSISGCSNINSEFDRLLVAVKAKLSDISALYILHI